MVIEHGAAPLHDAVQRPRNANVQALHAARQRQARVRLDEEMEVVAEEGELDEAEPEPFARIGEALFDRTEAALASQVPHAGGDAQGDEHDARLVELRTSLVRHPVPRRLPLAPGALSLSAPLRNLQCELFHLIGESLPKRPHIGHRSPDRSWDAEGLRVTLLSYTLWYARWASSGLH